MTTKWVQRFSLFFIAFLLSISVNISASAADFTQGADISGNNVTLWFNHRLIRHGWMSTIR